MRNNPSNLVAEHQLKIASEFFDAVESGRKPFEIRKGDRPFKVGDTLWLREVDIVLALTGRETRKRITFCLRGWGMESGYVALGLAPLQDETTGKSLPASPYVVNQQLLRESADERSPPKTPIKATCGFGGNYGRCTLEPDHDGRHEIPRPVRVAPRTIDKPPQ